MDDTKRQQWPPCSGQISRRIYFRCVRSFSVHLVGVYLRRTSLTGVNLIGVHLLLACISHRRASLTGIYLAVMWLIGVRLSLSGIFDLGYIPPYYANSRVYRGRH
jgi:hypothetical protein